MLLELRVVATRAGLRKTHNRIKNPLRDSGGNSCDAVVHYIEEVQCGVALELGGYMDVIHRMGFALVQGRPKRADTPLHSNSRAHGELALCPRTKTPGSYTRHVIAHLQIECSCSQKKELGGPLHNNRRCYLCDAPP